MRYIADCNGFQTERVAHDLTWERVANTNGGAGRNIPLDLKNEHLNNEFKGSLNNLSGEYINWLNVGNSSAFMYIDCHI